MEKKELKFIIPMYDIDSEKKYIGGKLTKGKYLGEDTKATDYAILNGLKTFISKNGNICGKYWLNKHEDVYDSPRERDDPPEFTAQATNSFGWAYPTDKSIGIKPALEISNIKIISEVVESYIYPVFYERDEEYLFIEFGEYPQNIVDNNLSNLLTRLYEENQLKQTGNTFSRDIGNSIDGMKCIEEEEYEYNGNKYVRAINLNPEGILTNGEKAGTKEYYWVKVEPVVWYIDKEENLARADKIIIGGVSFNDKLSWSYEETYAAKFINNYFAEDLTKNHKEKIKNIHKVKVQKIKHV